MDNAAVHELLERIDKLSDADRLQLERRLADRAEAEWRRESAVAKEIARERGLDQAAIDRSVEEVRYPSDNGDGQ